MGVPPILSVTEAQAFTAMRSFLLQVCVTGSPDPVEVFRGQAGTNQVPESGAPDFVVMSSLSQRRLSYNNTTYADDVMTASIADTTMTVASFARQQGPLINGMTITDGVWPTMSVAPNTVIVSQLSGTPGGVGTYQVSPSQTVASETMYAGLRSDLVPTELTIQLDVHGPAAGDNSRIIDGLFRSEYGIDAFEGFLLAEGAPSFSVVPLNCDVRGQLPFWNEQDQVEYRYVLEARMQIDPVISTPQEFATQIEVKLIDAVTAYPT